MTVILAVIISLMPLNLYAGEKEAADVARLVKDRLEWAGFWYGKSRTGLPYGVELPVLVKHSPEGTYDIVINHPLDIPGFDGVLVPFSSFSLFRGLLIEQQTESSYLGVPEELDEFRGEGAIYNHSIILDSNWLPVQGDDTITTRIADEIIFDMDKFFTAKRDSFPGIKDKEEIDVRLNKFTAADREVYMLIDGIDEVFFFKIHQRWPLPEQQHCIWNRKDLKFFNKNLLKKIKENSIESVMNIVDDWPKSLEELK